MNDINKRQKYNSDRNRRHRKISLRRRVLSLLLVVVFVFNLVPSSLFEDVLDAPALEVKAANKDAYEGVTFSTEENRVRDEMTNSDGSISISNVDDMLAYSRAYFSYPERHWEDTLDINYSDGDIASVIDEYIALGNETYPFKGKIKLETTSPNYLKIPEAFFDYIADSAQIVDGSNNVTPLIIQRIDENTGEPVFARHVKHDPDYSGAIRTFKVQLDLYNTNSYNSSAFIGEMDSDAAIVLDIIDNTTMVIKSKGTDVGYVCGKMDERSSLTVNSITTSTNTSYTIGFLDGYSGHAGGVVGSMEEGSELIIKCQMPNVSASVSASGSDKYAGGIVGYNDGGTITLNGFSTASKYAIKNTITGIAGSGGIAGYYRPKFDSNGECVFDVSCYSIGTNANRVAVNGTGSVGGLFGVLKNEIKTVTGAASSYSSGNITIKDLSNKESIIYADHSDGAMDNYGGLIGKYTACDLTSALSVKDVSVNVNRTGGSYTCYGGGIGSLEGGESNADNDLYVLFDEFVATAKGNTTSGSYYGGVIGDSANAFVDTKNVSVTSSDSFCGGGIIGNMEDGILRLIDTTTLVGRISAPAKGESYYTGQVVGHRDNSLIFGEYYVDSENNANSRQWKFNRGSAVKIDDIGSWGEVLRFDGRSSSTSNGVTCTSEKYGSATVLTVNESEHTVEIAVPTSQTTISSVADYALISLCFQINAAENPCLSFNSEWTYNYSTIPAANLSLGADVSLSGTGLLGLTRDNLTEDGGATTYCVYNGSFNGGSHKLTLAIGDPYGYRSNSLLNTHSAEGNGKIYRHQFNGMFGIYDWTKPDTAGAYSVKNITYLGTVDISSVGVNGSDKDLVTYCGTFAGRSLRDIVADNITTTAITVTHSGDKTLELGRFVGDSSSAENNSNCISVSNSTFSGNVTADVKNSASNGNTGTGTSIGGVIGQISHNSNMSTSWSFDTVVVGGTLSNDVSIGTHRIGGLIADINGSYTDNSNSRQLTLKDVSIEGLTVSGKASSSMGGLLGYSWNKTDVTATSVVVKNDSEGNKPTVSVSDNNANTAGLVFRATGHWTVTSIDIENIKMSVPGTGSVGMLVNRGISYHDSDAKFYSDNSKAAIYLELPAGYTYNLELDSTTSMPSLSVFDELCAYTAPSDSYIMKNGNGIVSIHSGLYTDSSTASGTYHAQTSYGAKANPNTRYYYNLDTVTSPNASSTVFTSTETGNKSAQNKLMSWGVNVYACTNLKKYFADTFTSNNNTTIANLNYDMNGYSWYPINIDKNVTVNGTFKFYNQEFEGSETAKYNAETNNKYNRTSLYHTGDASNTQHFLMHNGLFHDVNSTRITIGANGVTFAGTIAGYATSGNEATKCGALVCGTMTGTDSSHVAMVNTASNGNIRLESIRVYNVNAASEYALKVDGYAPLLINQASQFTTLEITDVSVKNTGTSSAPTSWYTTNSITGSSNPAATSLIGRAGNSNTSEGINVTFSKIKLDGRNKANALYTYNNAYSTYDTVLTKAYFTAESIFSKATLLHKLQFVQGSGSRGKYDYGIDLDWNASTGTAIHNVTYGKEVGYTSTDTTTQYYNQERKYVGQTAYFTSPITNTDGSGNDSLLFKNHFLPYVLTPYDAATFETKGINQLEVNHNVSVDITGCGTYDDPYQISSFEQILSVQRSMGSNHDSGAKFYIPAEITSTSNINNTLWCGTPNTHMQYIYVTNVGYCAVTNDHPEGDTSRVLGGTKANSEQIVRRYLAGAYYKITTSFTIPYSTTTTKIFYGLGRTKNEAGLYEDAVFHGVISGGNNTITNQSQYPLIYASNGCVVKNLTVISDVDGTNTDASKKKTLPDSTKGNSNYFNGYSSNTAYGTVIGRVLGGDNIIDKVTVSFTAGTTIKIEGTQSQLVPIGGYVGVVVNGGIIFRNMNNVTAASKNASIFNNVTFSASNGNASNTVDDAPLSEDNHEWLYINPIIGRVINGYAVTESDAYRPYEDGTRTYKGGATNVTEYWASWNTEEVGEEVTTVTKHIGAVDSATYNETDYSLEPVTMQNGNKNYSIADIDSDSDKQLLDVDSSRNIKAPDGQTLFLMSIMVNSGMSLQADASSGTNASIGGYYRPSLYYTVRHSNYDRVGDSTLLSSDTVYTDSKEDKYSNDQVPYIISAYTMKNDDKYYAKIMAAAINNCKIILGKYNSSTKKYDAVDYYIPDGYKGIGNIYSDDSGLQLDVINFDGNASRLLFNTSVYYYWKANSSAYDEKYNLRDKSGVGLFNYQPGITNNASSSRYYNFELSGNVVGECIDSNSKDGNHILYDGNNSQYNNDYAGNGIDHTKMISSGGLIGDSDAEQYIDSVSLNNVYIKGVKHSGGLIGRVSGEKSTAKNTTIRNTLSKASDKIKVHGAGNVGGMVGRSFNGKIDIDNGNASYNITEVVCECEKRTGYDYNYGVGGFIGNIRTSSTGDNDVATIKNVTVGTKDMKAATFVKSLKASVNAGGLIGVVNKPKLTVSNCYIYNQSVESLYNTGGLIGYFASANKDSIIEKTEIYTNKDAKAKIKNTDNTEKPAAGGFLGAGKGDLNPLTINECSITGYTIEGVNYAGGIIGIWANAADNGNKKDTALILQNIKLDDCSVSATTSGYAGGLAGHLNAPDGKKKNLYGYNIQEANVAINASTAGTVAGWLINKDQNNIKIAGFSRTGTVSTVNTVGKSTKTANGDDVTATVPYGTNGYVIFADYAGASLSAGGYSNTFSTINESYTESSNTYKNINYDETSGSATYHKYVNYTPFVTSANKTNIDSTLFLTSDGIGFNGNSISYSSSRIGSILSAVNGGTDNKRYKYAYDAVGGADTADLISKLNTYGKLSSYKSEMAEMAMTEYNFPVLVLDDSGVESCTKFINNYLRYMTNTDFDFAKQAYSDGVASSASAVFKVVLGACVWNGTDAFTYNRNPYATSNPNGAYVDNNVNTGKFSLVKDKYDNKSTTGRFTLIDVQFFDPSDTTHTQIAYHLYVPVLVKKMLHYDFEASFQAGTTYRVQPYDAHRGNSLVENIGNPVTLEMRWSYNRNLSEWQSALESGDSFLVTLDKKLRVNDNGTGLPSGVKLVLVDANNNNKYYYATYGAEGYSELYTSDSVTGDMSLNLSAFKDTSGHAFSSVDFSDFFMVTVTEATESTITKFRRLGPGTSKEDAIADGATISDGTYYYAPDSSGTCELSLSYKAGVSDSSGNIIEDYYVSFFTDDSDIGFYHLVVSDRGKFDGDYPTKVANNDSTHFVTGDIFINDLDIVSVNSLTNAQEMSLAVSSYNDTLTGVLKATVGIKPAQRSAMASYLSRNSVEVYHSFLVMLNKQDLSSSDRGILTVPVISVSNYNITHTNTSTEEVVTDKVIDTETQMSNVYDLLNANYIELRSNENLKTYLRNTCIHSTYDTIDINATVSLGYPDEAKMKAQFPTRDQEHIDDSRIGTIFGAASGISANPEAASFNKTVEEDWDGVPYYITLNTNANLILNSDDANNKLGEYYQLGINGLDIDTDSLTEDEYVPMKLNAVYNVKDLADAEKAQSMKITITLSKKVDYDVTLPINTYISDLVLKDGDDTDFSDASNASTITVDTSNTSSFVYTVQNPMVNLDYSSTGMTYQIPITFAVKAGDAFEEAGLQYSNYMIKMEVDMYTDTAATEVNKITGSHDTDHVIWTHTRIVPGMVTDEP